MESVVVGQGESVMVHRGQVEVGLGLSVRQEELSALAEAEEHVTGLDGAEGDGVAEAEGQAAREPRKKPDLGVARTPGRRVAHAASHLSRSQLLQKLILVQSFLVSLIP